MKKRFPTMKIVLLKFKNGDYVSSVNYPEKQFRVFKAMSFKNIILIEITDDPTKQIDYIVEHQDNLTLIKNSPLKFFKAGREVYNKKLKEKGWVILSVAPSGLSESFDIAHCRKGRYEYTNFLVHDLVPEDERSCVECCNEILHYSTHDDCPVCRYYICSEGHCECNTAN